MYIVCTLFEIFQSTHSIIRTTWSM